MSEREKKDYRNRQSNKGTILTLIILTTDIGTYT